MTDTCQRNWEYPTEEKIDAEIIKAKQLQKDSSLSTARVRSVYCTKSEQNIFINLNLVSGALITFPIQLVEELKHASEEALKDQWIGYSGDSIHWDSLDFDIHTEDLIKRVISNNKQ